MPKEVVHKAQSLHNKEFYNEQLFSSTKYDDWRVVAMFYEIVHLVEAYIYKKYGKHSKDHKQRREFIESDPQLDKILVDYNELYDLTNKARYLCIPMTSMDLIAVQEDVKFISDYIKKQLLT